jgi:hypothetical protein
MKLPHLPIAAGVLAAVVAGMPHLAHAQTGETRGLERLTVPGARLPQDCRLQPAAPASSVTDARHASGVVVTAPPLGPARRANPWVGDERRDVAMIRLIVDPPPPGPDGPPLDRRQSARYFLRSADGVRAAYRAVYLAPDESPIQVYAVRFETEALAAATRAPRSTGAVYHAVRGADAILVSARASSPCFDAIRDHVASQQRPDPPDVEPVGPAREDR